VASVALLSLRLCAQQVRFTHDRVLGAAGETGAAIKTLNAALDLLPHAIPSFNHGPPEDSKL
jgi:hypothetical protein